MTHSVLAFVLVRSRVGQGLKRPGMSARLEACILAHNGLCVGFIAGLLLGRDVLNQLSANSCVVMCKPTWNLEAGIGNQKLRRHAPKPWTP